MLKVDYIRDGKNQIIGSKTSGFANGDTVARGHTGRILGHSSEKFGNTRDASGKLVSRNIGDVGLLLCRKTV